MSTYRSIRKDEAGNTRATYFYYHPATDPRPVEQRTCGACGALWDVRIPSVAESWETCPTCQAQQFATETLTWTRAKTEESGQ